MRHEEIIKNEDGSRIKITISMSTDPWKRADVHYEIFVEACEPRKRTFKPVIDEDGYAYRCLSIEDRREYRFRKNIETAGKEAINNAMLECWKKTKPELY